VCDLLQCQKRPTTVSKELKRPSLDQEAALSKDVVGQGKSPLKSALPF
jgi:hypothetical protein